MVSAIFDLYKYPEVVLHFTDKGNKKNWGLETKNWVK